MDRVAGRGMRHVMRDDERRPGVRRSELGGEPGTRQLVLGQRVCRRKAGTITVSADQPVIVDFAAAAAIAAAGSPVTA